MKRREFLSSTGLTILSTSVAASNILDNKIIKKWISELESTGVSIEKLNEFRKILLLESAINNVQQENKQLLFESYNANLLTLNTTKGKISLSQRTQIKSGEPMTLDQLSRLCNPKTDTAKGKLEDALPTLNSLFAGAIMSIAAPSIATLGLQHLYCLITRTFALFLSAIIFMVYTPGD